MSNSLLARRFLLVSAACGIIASFSQAQTIDPRSLAGLQWRNIGPFRGGRVSAVTGVMSEPGTFYIGLPQSGVWKTTSAGQTWYPVFDSVTDISTIGSVQVAPSDPNIVYVGTGEISEDNEGIGIYRSADAGKSWEHIGLEATRQIPALLVDPNNPNIVLAAALGNLKKRTDERGVYRTTDGGKTWKKTLFIDNEIGIQHLARAYDNPSVVYATAWKHFNGPPLNPKAPPPPPTGAEIYKSTDEGITWVKLTSDGLPKVDGRATVAVAQGTNSQRLFIIGLFGLYRSDDGGEHWHRMAAHDSRIANGQGNYSSGVYVDPKNPDIVYTIATCVYRSLDGGKTFDGFKGAPGGDDPHQMWIDPNDGNRILLGGDQGATVSQDGGKTWGSWYNQPTGQIYKVATDNRWPYWVYGSQQDSGCIATASRGNLGAITPLDWAPNAGFEVGTVLPDPLDPNITYALGPSTISLCRINALTGQWVEINPAINPKLKLRGGFGSPTFSPTNPHELISPYQCLMASTDRGNHWNPISPDLTVDSTTKSPGKGVQPRPQGTIASFSCSPKDGKVIWVGTSNGLIKLTRDHGRTWSDVSFPKAPSGPTAAVFCMEASAVDTATAYAAVGSTFFSGAKPQIYRTHDFGKTWTAIGQGLPNDELKGSAIKAVKADSQQPGLLFAVTNAGIFVSVDDGNHWQSLRLNLPKTELSDMTVHGNDLVISTFGRGFWILDDYAPLRELSAKTAEERVHLFKPSEAIRVRRNLNGDTPFPPEVPHAKNPPLGAVIYYSLSEKPASVSLEILDRDGKVVRHMSSAPIPPYDDPAPPVPSFWVEMLRPMPTDLGLNRINWDLRYDIPPAFNHDVGDVMAAIEGDTPAAIEGPLVLPGEYTLRLSVDGKSTTQKLSVRNDPRSTATLVDLKQDFQVQMGLYACTQAAWDGYQRVASMRSSVAALRSTNKDADVEKAAKTFDATLAALGGTVSHERRFFGPPSSSSFVGLNGALLTRLESLNYGDGEAYESELYAYGSDWAKLRKLTDQWRAICKKDLADFNAVLAKHGVEPVKADSSPLAEPPAPPKKYLPDVAGK